MIERVDVKQDVFRECGLPLALWTDHEASNGSVQTGLHFRSHLTVWHCAAELIISHLIYLGKYPECRSRLSLTAQSATKVYKEVLTCIAQATNSTQLWYKLALGVRREVLGNRRIFWYSHLVLRLRL